MHQINDSAAAYYIFKNDYNPFCEEFWLLTLDTQLNLINKTLLSRGTLNFCLVHPRDLFRQAVRDNAFNLLIAHNHPSGNLQPTSADIQMTKNLRRLSLLLQIPIVDHIIFSNCDYYSFKQNRLIFK